MGRILQPLDISIAENYVDLMHRIGADVGVNQEDLDEILAVESRPKPICAGDGCQWRLTVHKRHSIEFADDGKVFEIQGRSNTNKTFTLAYLGTLLGVDWSSLEDFLQDSKMMERAKEAVAGLRRGQKAYLSLKTGIAELSIEVEDKQSRVALRNVASGEFLYGLDGTSFSLRSEDDWREYRQRMSQVCDVQIVAKRRNFVAQVGLDEGRDLGEFAGYIVARCSRVYQFLEKSLPSDHFTAVATETDLPRLRTGWENEKRRLEERIREIKSQHYDASLAGRYAQDALNLRHELSTYPLAEEYARAARELESAEQISNDLANLRESLEDLRNQLQVCQADHGQQQSRLSRVDAVLQSATSEVEKLLPRLAVLAAEGDSLLLGLRTKNVETILQLAAWPQFSDETSEVYGRLLESLEGISLSVPIEPMAAEGETIGSVGTLKRYLEKTRGKVADRIALRGIAAQLADVLQNDPQMPIISAEEYRQFVSRVATAGDVVKTLEREIQTLEGKIGRHQEFLYTVLRGRTLDIMRTDLIARKNQLAGDVASKIQRLGELAADLGINDPWVDQTQIAWELRRRMEDSDQKAQELGGELRETEFKLKALDSKIQELDHIVPEARARSARESRLGAIERFQGIAQAIPIYLENLGKDFGGKDVRFSSKTEDARRRIGKHFELVINALNQRILDRCPVRYVNRGHKVSCEPVRGYDFIQGKPVLDFDEDEGAGGGEDSAMTVRGLATKEGRSVLGTVLLVDEFGDAVDTFGDIVYQDLAELSRLTLAIFVDQQKELEKAVLVKKV